MIMALKNNLSLLKIAFKGWWSKDPFRESAVIAYYSILSLPGLLVVIVIFAGYFFGRDVVNKNITDHRVYTRLCSQEFRQSNSYGNC